MARARRWPRSAPPDPAGLVRPIRPGDSAAVAALIRAAFASLHVDPAPSALRVTEGTIRRHLEGGGGLLAAPDHGCLLWCEAAGGLYLSRLAVHPAQRGRGVARALLAGAEQEARRRGLPRMWLSTRLALESNRRLFARCGFAETAQHAHPGFDRPTYVEMERQVGA